MIKDYSGGMILTTGRNRIITPRRNKTQKVHELFHPTRYLQKVIGVILLLTLLMGLGSTVWYGLQIRVALDQIGNQQGLNTELRDENKLLAAQRDLLLTQVRMQEAASRLGLVLPGKDQVRYR